MNLIDLDASPDFVLKDDGELIDLRGSMSASPEFSDLTPGQLADKLDGMAYALADCLKEAGGRFNLNVEPDDVFDFISILAQSSRVIRTSRPYA